MQSAFIVSLQGQSGEATSAGVVSRAADIRQRANEAKDDFKAGKFSVGEEKLANILTHSRGTPKWHRDYAHLLARTAILLREDREKAKADQLAKKAVSEFESSLSLLDINAVEDRITVLKALAFLQENYYRNLEAAANAYAQVVALAPDSRRDAKKLERLQVEISLQQ